jgi:hypothetical protein
LKSTPVGQALRLPYFFATERANIDRIPRQKMGEQLPQAFFSFFGIRRLMGGVMRVDTHDGQKS